MMKNRWLGALAAMLLAACTGETTGSSEAGCADVVGNYTVAVKRVGGTCPDGDGESAEITIGSDVRHEHVSGSSSTASSPLPPRPPKERTTTMDDSGRIYNNVTAAQARERNLIPIPPAEEEKVRSMNRKQRRAWAAQQRKEKANAPVSSAPSAPLENDIGDCE